MIIGSWLESDLIPVRLWEVEEDRAISDNKKNSYSHINQGYQISVKAQTT
jgi:hypothetical protein